MSEKIESLIFELRNIGGFDAELDEIKDLTDMSSVNEKMLDHKNSILVLKFTDRMLRLSMNPTSQNELLMKIYFEYSIIFSNKLKK